MVLENIILECNNKEMVRKVSALLKYLGYEIERQELKIKVKEFKRRTKRR